MNQKTLKQKSVEHTAKRRATIAAINATERSPAGREARIHLALRHYDDYVTIPAIAKLTGDTNKQIRDTLADMLEDELVEYVTIKCDCARMPRRAFRIAGNF